MERDDAAAAGAADPGTTGGDPVATTSTAAAPGPAPDGRTRSAAPPPSGTVRGRAWVERADGWHAVTTPTPGVLDLSALPGDARTTWVVTDDLDGLAEVTRALAPDPRAADLLARHLLRAQGGPHPRAKVDRGAGGQVVLTAPTVSFVERTRDVRTGWVACVVCPDLVVTSERGHANVLPAAAERLLDGVKDPDRGARAVLAAVLLTLVQQASDVEVEVGDAVASTERAVFSDHPSADVLSDVYDLKREIAEARRALGPVGAALPDLADAWGEQRHGDPAWLRRVQSGVDRIDRHLEAHDALLGDMLAVHLAQVSVRQNEDMRRISAWAAVIAVPTLVAGVYGMNFEHMPELTWRFGYPLALAVMGGACVVLWRAFRRSGWL